MKKMFLIALAVVTGCVTADTARIVQRCCPVKRVEGDRAAYIVMKDLKYDGRYVYVIGECKWDSEAIKEWCDKKGIVAEVVPAHALYNRKVIKYGHRAVLVNGKLLNYIDGKGVSETPGYRSDEGGLVVPKS